jgi:tetratricopeptide (TPR) repeat protein
MFLAKVLRDVRVDGMILADSYQVKFFPRWPLNAREIAQELYFLGVEAFQESQEESALMAWRRCIEVQPDFADAYESIGVVLGRQEKFIEAESWMRKLLHVDPDSVMAHTNLSLFLMRQNRIQEAEEHKAKATIASFKSFGKEASQKKKKEEERKKLEEELLRRENMFLQVLEIDPDDNLALYGLGSIRLETGKFEEAIHYLQKVVQVDPSYAVAYLSLGKAYNAIGRKEYARDIWSRGIKIAAKKGDLMPANEMQSLLNRIS